MNRNESRFFNTAKKMHDAFIRLIDRKDFETISVKEICDEAGVNRSTFYLHYDNTNDLLVETVEAVYGDFFSRYASLKGELGDGLENKSANELFFVTPRYLTPYLDFVRENRKLFKLMNDKSDVLGTEKMYSKWFKEIFSPILTSFRVPDEEHPYIMVFYLKGLIGVIMEWVDNDCSVSYEMLMDILRKCIMRPEDRRW